MAATFDELKDTNGSNIRKALEMTIFVKPKEEADEEIKTIWTVADGLTVPVGYQAVGYMTKADGAAWSREQDWAEVESHGESEPTRRDSTKDSTGLAFTMQESKKLAMELFHGLDLSEITTDTDGNFYFDKGSRPVSRRYRVLALAKDGDGPDAIYTARWLPDAQVTETGDQAWSEEDEIQYPATFATYTDKKFGTSFREIWGGPGVDHEAMGFTAPAGG